MISECADSSSAVYTNDTITVLIKHLPKYPIKLGQFRIVWIIFVDRVRAPFIYISRQQHSHIIITSNILEILSLTVVISFQKSIFIIELISILCVKQRDSRNLLNWQREIKHECHTYFMATGKKFVMNCYIFYNLSRFHIHFLTHCYYFVYI